MEDIIGDNYRLGVDIGGTFTDFVLMNETSGDIQNLKMPSTPNHPSKSVVSGIRRFAEQASVRPDDIKYFVHGTTLGVNAILERKGATCGLLITDGFRDILNLGRSRLPDIFDLLTEKPRPMVARRHVREIGERMLQNGEVYKKLPADKVLDAVTDLVADGIEALAISFLHSYRNPQHEVKAKELVTEQFPDLYVCTSSEIWPQIREFERTLVAVVNCFVGRRMNEYFGSLQEEVAATGLASSIRSTKSNGGIMSVESARRAPVETLASGPASGVIGAHFVSLSAGVDKVIAMDMGGTSTEVAVIDGDIRFSVEAKIGGFEIATPAVDVNSIGAGGGSIAWTDRSSVLKVGPRSAGADPGPACYDRSGSKPTITDAYVVMGIVDPDRFLGGEMPLSYELAAKAIDTISGTLGLNRMAAADAILRVATSNMYSALVPLMARKGIDLSEFSLLCYGGAGPTHGFLLSREVGVQRVLVPHSPGTLCALGSLVADVKTDLVATLYQTIDSEASADVLAEIRATVDELTERAFTWLEGEGIETVDRQVLMSADMRYLGQSFEVTTNLEDIDFGAGHLAQGLRNSFAEAYAAIYGGAESAAPVEIINLRATAIGVTTKPKLARIGSHPATGEASSARPDRQREVFLDGGVVTANVFDRTKLCWGNKFLGPAIIEQYDTTTFVPEGFHCDVDEYGTIIAEFK